MSRSRREVPGFISSAQFLKENKLKRPKVKKPKRLTSFMDSTMLSSQSKIAGFSPRMNITQSNFERNPLPGVDPLMNKTFDGSFLMSPKSRNSNHINHLSSHGMRILSNDDLICDSAVMPSDLREITPLNFRRGCVQAS